MSYSAIYSPDLDFDRHFTLAAGGRIRRWLRPGDRVLEVGCATGLMTAQFAGRGVRVIAIDHAPDYIEAAGARGLDFADFVVSGIEELEFAARFQQIVATNLLSELPDPAGFLARARELLAPGGMLHVTINNPRSLHRLLALELGMIRTLDEPSERGTRYLSRRLLDADQLSKLGEGCSLACVHREPLMLKPLTNDQLAELPDELIEGLDRAARWFPDNGAMNYAIFVRDE